MNPFSSLSFSTEVICQRITKKKLSSKKWCEVVSAAVLFWCMHFSDWLSDPSQSLHISLQGIRRNAEGVPEMEENFEEAIRNVNTSLSPTKVSYQLLRCIVFESGSRFHSWMFLHFICLLLSLGPLRSPSDLWWSLLLSVELRGEVPLASTQMLIFTFIYPMWFNNGSIFRVNPSGF